MTLRDPPAEKQTIDVDDTPPQGRRSLVVLYLYAGAKRKADLRTYLLKHCKEKGLILKMVEIDIIRNRKRGDLMNKQRRNYFLAQARRGAYDAIFTSPPCGTFSRARWANKEGPRPLRLARFPRGFPWLSGAQKQGVEEANVHVDFSTDMLRIQFERNEDAIGLMEHPEDLGAVRGGDHPGSAWQFNGVKGLVALPGVVWGALLQSDWGRPYPKPSRLLGRLKGLDGIVYEGPPDFDADSRYKGPAPRAIGVKPMTIGRNKAGGFHSTTTAAWPPPLCDALAEKVVAHFTSCGGKAQESGETRRRGQQEGQGEQRRRGQQQEGQGEQQVAHRGRGVLQDDQPHRSQRLPGEAELQEGLPMPSTTSRKALRDFEKVEIKAGRSIEGVYVGRPSVWGNPYKIGVDGNREEVIQLYRQYLQESGLSGKATELRGSTLRCHCRDDQACHADVLIELAEGAAVVPGVPKFAEPEGHSYEKELEDIGGPPQNWEVRPKGRCVGWGPPRVASNMGVKRQFVDGGGLCSPGRWAREDRKIRDFGMKDLVKALRDIFITKVSDGAGKHLNPMEFALNLAAGKFPGAPFAEDMLQEARFLVAGYFNLPGEATRAVAGQELRLDLIAAILEKAGDPDWRFFIDLKKGVNLGVDQELPRAGEIFEEKVKWKLDLVDGPGAHEQANYGTFHAHQEAVRELFLKEAELGWMVEMSDEAAQAEYGDKLFVAGLAVVQEPGKIRVVHDGSNGVHVNHRIRLRDQVRSPGAGELRAILKKAATEDSKMFMLAGDVSKAHRRIKVRREDWGFQACRLEPGKVWLNCVGTYGMTPAGYYWARAAAGGLVRLAHYLLGPEGLHELLIYVDDFIVFAESQKEVEMSGFLVFIWCVLGFTFRWNKFKGGTGTDWIGYRVEVRGFAVGISVRRAQWLSNWMRARLSEGFLDMNDFEAVLGRLCFALAPLEYLRPFIAPLYAWSSAVNHRGKMRIPWSIAFILTYFAREFENEGRMFKIRPVENYIGEAFRADAKAEGQCVVIGGWECLGNTPPGRARWYSVRLDRKNAPWAFSRGEPFRTIAALELYATLVSYVVFSPNWPAATRGAVLLSGTTDNLGNTFILSRMMTSKFPALVILTELAARLRQDNAELQLAWAPRDQNEEADSLTNEHFEDFDEARRIDFNPLAVEWLVLNDMLAVSEEINEVVKQRRSGSEKGGEAPPSRKRPPGERLRARDPW